MMYVQAASTATAGPVGLPDEGIGSNLVRSTATFSSVRLAGEGPSSSRTV